MTRVLTGCDTGKWRIYPVIEKALSLRGAPLPFDMGADDSEVGNLREKVAALEKQLHEQRQANERFQLIVESAPNGILVADRAGSIIHVNRMAEEQFGYSAEEFVTLSIEDLIPMRFRGSHEQHREGFHAAPEMRQMGSGRDLYALRKDGSEFPVEIGLTPLPGGDVLSSIADITGRKKAESVLKSYAEELERSNSELDSFASIASHDLREPLRKIRTIGERLAKISENDLSEKGKDYLARMINASDRMHQLIVDLLSFSQVSTRSRPFEPVNLDAPLKDALSALEIAIEEANASIISRDLPSVEVDISQFRQVFQNLIGNAVKFAKPDTPPVVEISGGDHSDTHIEIHVRDNGIGFDEKFAERIFTLFQRLHGRNAYEGTGVGLAICKKIVERHGGTIEVSSSPGEGSVFRIILPREQPPSRFDGTTE